MPTRSALPQNYLLNTGTLFEDFETFSDWTFTYTKTGVPSVNTTQYTTGTQSLRLSCSENGAMIYAKKTISFNASEMESISMDVYCHTATNDTGFIRMDFSLDNFVHRNRMSWTANINFQPGQWQKITCRKTDFDLTTFGGSWADPMTGMIIKAESYGNATLDVSIDNLRFNFRGLPRLVISFDDGYKSDLGSGETPQAYMATRGIFGTIYTISNYVGASGKFSLAELQALYAQGWAIANHTNNHAGWINGTITTQAEYETVIKDCVDYLIKNNMPRVARHLAYPGGIWNVNVLAAMANQGMVTGRTTLGNYQSMPLLNNFLIKCRCVAPTISLSTAQGWVDEAINKQSSLHLAFHDITDGSGTGNKWPITNYKALIDYIVARKVRCVTIDEFYKGLTSPRYRSLLLSRP